MLMACPNWIYKYVFLLGHDLDDVTYFSVHEIDGYIIPEVQLDRELYSSFSLLIEVVPYIQFPYY